MRVLMLICSLFLLSLPACGGGHQPKNSLSQHTREAGSTQPKARPPRYPNTAGNIVAPPGNPAGNDAGAPPIVGGTESQHGGWPEGR